MAQKRRDRTAKAKPHPKLAESKQTEAFDAAIAAANENGASPPDEVELRNGVKLRLKTVPPLLVRKATAGIQRPKVPIWNNPDKGRDEENPNDPAYVQAMNEYGQKVFDAGANYMLAMGTEVISVPEGICRPEEDGWIEQLQAVDFDPDVRTDAARRLSWLSYYAITVEEDVIKIVMGVTKLTGVSEKEVAEAVSSFRGRKVRGTDPDVSAEEADDRD